MTPLRRVHCPEWYFECISTSQIHEYRVKFPRIIAILNVFKWAIPILPWQQESLHKQCCVNLVERFTSSPCEGSVHQALLIWKERGWIYHLCSHVTTMDPRDVHQGSYPEPSYDTECITRIRACPMYPPPTDTFVHQIMSLNSAGN